MKQQTGMLWLLLLAGLFLGSCTNPYLRPPGDEDGDIEEVISDEAVTDSEEAEFSLDRIGVVATEDGTDSSAFIDTVVAVDDYVWRQLNLAHEYCLMGVLANSESIWDEAEYYFEKGLSILGDLDIETEAETVTEESVRYNRILAEIAANYKITLVSLGRLPSDVSADALMARFSEINHIKVDSSAFKRLEEYAEEEVAFNVPVIMNERVKNCILYYQTVARDAFRTYLGRSTKFIPMIERIFREEGVPTDIKYLALVESGYNPKAYSWAKAMGLWQFIASTGRTYDLNRNWWYDERKDPEKATLSAARFLKDLYEEFGSWELAMAAYNGGPGRVNRTIKSQKTRDFWKMRLKKQTMDYVPFFMAAAHISRNPDEFGFVDIQYEPEWTFDAVEIDKSLDLNIVADAVGCTVANLKELNPELLRDFTPPAEGGYKLRIPQGSEDRFWAAYEDMPNSKQTSWVRHTIRQGETISTIAKKYGISQYSILSANNLSNRAKIYAGKTLVVPVPNDRGYSTPRQQNRAFSSDGGVYTVRSGDTVWDIAKAFGVSSEQLRRWNNLDGEGRIFVGQKLKVSSEGSESSASAPSSSGTAAEDTYVVKKGDSLWDIATRLGISADALRQANGLGRRGYIYPGQKLKIPGTAASDRFMVHTVKRGDTVAGIASLYGTTVDKIISWNNISDPRRIGVGDRLKIYGKK